MEEIPDGLYPEYKPKGMTSNAYLNKFKREHCIKKRKCGFAGTLDPLAEGLLLIAVGRQYTRQLTELSNSSKTYEAIIALDGTTESYDLEQPVQSAEVIIPGQERILEVLQTFVGEQEQMPPVFSAKQVKGVRAYKLAHELGKEAAEQRIQLKPKRITIHEIQLLETTETTIKIRVSCSSGTYIRALARDIGQRLTGQNVGYLSYLLRTQVGKHTITI